MGLTFHYVSISTRSDVHGSVGECLFTFHYVSISTNSKEDNKRLLSIYIPLCIYFNLFPNKPNPFFTQFTFHYVSISTFTAHFISDIVTCIYIPLCTYFNRRNCCINSASSRIYIPLRIYFNLIVCDFLHLDFLFTFHYVSISTITPMVALVRPLHLHSTMYLFQLHSRSFILISFIIYIPLCIYFNPIRKAATKKPSKFTFHYVSISTILTKYAIQYIKQFTFHYVSISTLSAVVRPILMILIYIPLCIYFNLLEGFALGLVLVFTFHYVSISTSGKTLSAVKRLVFTFHYVSISTGPADIIMSMT